MKQAILDRKAVRKARRLNPYYAKRLGWLGWPNLHGWPSDVSSAAFARRVADFQDDRGQLVIDGIIGPKTWAAIKGKGKVWEPPTRNYLIVAENYKSVSFPVVTWDEFGGMSFKGQAGWRRRADSFGKVNLLVLHWDACISSHQCFHTLLSRNLSVHLMVDGDGTVYQALDLAMATAYHAGNFNGRSIGIEIQNPVFQKYNHTQKPLRPAVSEPKVHSNGRPWDHLDFHDIQKKRVVELVEVICEWFNIPRVLPMNGEQVSRHLAPPRFKGVCGHYHLSKNKIDPGLSLWPGLLNSFAAKRK